MSEYGPNGAGDRGSGPIAGAAAGSSALSDLGADGAGARENPSSGRGVGLPEAVASAAAEGSAEPAIDAGDAAAAGGSDEDGGGGAGFTQRPASPEAFCYTQAPVSAEASDVLRAVPLEGGSAAVIGEAGIFLGASRPAEYLKRADAESAQRGGQDVRFVSGQHARVALTSPGAEETSVVCTAAIEGMWITVDDGDQLGRGVRAAARAGSVISLGSGSALLQHPPVRFLLVMAPADDPLEVTAAGATAMQATGGGGAGKAPGVVFRVDGPELVISAADAGFRASHQVAAVLAGARCDVGGWRSEGRAIMPADAIRAGSFGGRHIRAFRHVAAQLNLIGDGYAIPSSFVVREEVLMRGCDVCTFPSPDQCKHEPRHRWHSKSKKRSRSRSPPQAGAGGGGAGSGADWLCSSCGFRNFSFRAECLKCAGGSVGRKRQRGGGGKVRDSSEACRDFRRGKCYRGSACRFSHSHG